MVISKVMYPTPNLTSIFKTHKNVGGHFYFVYKYIYIMFYIATKYEEQLKDTFDYRPSVPSFPSNSRFALGSKASGAGPRRDIVGA